MANEDQISIDEVEQLVNANYSLYRTTRRERHLRDAFIISFLAFTGLSTTEFVLTTRKDVDLENKLLNAPHLRIIHEEGKGMCPEERYNNDLIPYSQISLDHVPEKQYKIWTMWLSKRNPDEFLTELKDRAIWRNIHELSKEYLKKPLNPSKLNRAFGLYLFSIGKDFEEVKTTMRHVSAEPTFKCYELAKQGGYLE